MRKILFLFILLVSLSVNANDTPLIKKKIAEWQWETIKNRKQFINDVKSFSDVLSSKGLFNDINYTITDKSIWQAFEHLNRIYAMTIAYTANWSQLKKNPDLYTKIQLSLNYWNESNLKNPNWWWNDIAVPQKIGTILVMMQYAGDRKLDFTLENTLISKMPTTTIDGKTGANWVDFNIHALYRGCLTNNSVLIQNSATEIFNINSISTAEGIQEDFSYAQHGIQLHIFGYGTVYFQGQVYAASILTNTPFTIPKAKLNVLSSFTREAFLPQIRGNVHNFNAFSRQISRKNGTNVDFLIPYIEKMKIIDSDYATFYENALLRIKKKSKPGYGYSETHKYFWRTDFSFFQNKNFQFSTKFVSKNTCYVETGNNENLKGGFLSMGATTLSMDGSEYFNIYPVWDWAKIPGTTVPQKAIVPVYNWNTNWAKRGKSNFAGGVSNGKIGLSTFFMEDEWETSAKKAWFIFENETMCLGSNISSTAPENIVTTVEQNVLNGAVSFSENGIKSTFKDNASINLNKIDWVLHNNVAYLFPNSPSNLNLSTIEQNGSWSAINETQSKDIVKTKVFKLWFEHGVNPINQKYAYIMIPNIKNTKALNKYNYPDLTILSNTANVQAVQKKSTGTIQAVFYQAGTLTTANTSISVDKPCAIILEDVILTNGKFYISDPLKSEENTITVKINSTALTNKVYICEMPKSEALLGSTINVNLN